MAARPFTDSLVLQQPERPPHRINPAAVLAFIVARPGHMLFSGGLLPDF